MKRAPIAMTGILIAISLACRVQVDLTSTPAPILPVTSTAYPAGDLGFGIVGGQVTDSITGAPIVNATVQCQHTSYTAPEGSRCNRSTVTDANGQFIFENIFFHDTDLITLTISAEGYTTSTITQPGFTQPQFIASIQMTNTNGQAPSAPSPGGTSMAGCPIFPENNFWNARIDTLPVHPLSNAWIDSIGRGTGFHMDFGSGTWNGGPIGIPFNIVAGSSAPKFEPVFYYPDESDRGPYPIPENPNIEYGSDHHILTIDTETCTLYEMYDASFDGTTWNGGSGAIWDLNSNALRPDVWTSADAAGLPILPGLARYDEIETGTITHAFRFTAEQTAGYIWPARHQTSETQNGIPPMGARFRLKADYDISGFPPEMRIMLQALKTYGIVLADNGSNWFITGTPDEGWDNDMLHLLDVLTGDDFEAVDTSLMMVDANSGQVK